MADPWSIIFSALKTADSVLDENKRKTLWKKLQLLFKHKRKIVVFGISGAGKTQFVYSILDKLNVPDRTSTAEGFKFDLENFPLYFIDTPGHIDRSGPRKSWLKNTIHGDVEGIINVVSYGYEENTLSDTSAIFDEHEEIKDSYLKLNRKAEIDRLPEWLSVLDGTEINFIITLATKADIWWENVDQVFNYYDNGEYKKAMKEFQNFPNLHTFPYCSIIKPFYGIKTSGRFGELQKAAMHNTFLTELLKLLKEE